MSLHALEIYIDKLLAVIG